MKIAVPSNNPGGLKAGTSAHFGHCDVFTLVEVENGEIRRVGTLANEGHAQGGCLSPVGLLKGSGVDVLVAGGMGPRPLAGFQSVGIEVYFNEGASTVGAAVEHMLKGTARVFGPAHTCGGGQGHCH